MNYQAILRGLLLGVVILFAVLALLGWHMLGTAPLRAALPGNAADITDWLQQQPPGFDYLLRARLMRADYDAYCAKLKLRDSSPEDATSAQVEINWTPPAGAPGWWMPHATPDLVRYAIEGGVVTIARYEDGWLLLRCRTLPPTSSQPASLPAAGPVPRGAASTQPG